MSEMIRESSGGGGRFVIHSTDSVGISKYSDKREKPFLTQEFNSNVPQQISISSTEFQNIDQK
jgi:hypothetical protein